MNPKHPLWLQKSFPKSFCVKNSAGRSFRKNSSLLSTFYRYLHLNNLKRRKLSSWGYKMEENWNGKWNKSFCFDLWVITAEANISIQNAPLVYVARMFCHQNLGGVNWNLSCGFCGTLICFLNLIYFRAGRFEFLKIATHVFFFPFSFLPNRPRWKGFLQFSPLPTTDQSMNQSLFTLPLWEWCSSACLRANDC